MPAGLQAKAGLCAMQRAYPGSSQGRQAASGAQRGSREPCEILSHFKNETCVTHIQGLETCKTFSEGGGTAILREKPC